MIDKSEANLAAREAINAKRETLPVAQVQGISLRPHCPERHRSNAHDRHGVDERANTRALSQSGWLRLVFSDNGINGHLTNFLCNLQGSFRSERAIAKLGLGTQLIDHAGIVCAGYLESCVIQATGGLRQAHMNFKIAMRENSMHGGPARMAQEYS